MSPEERFEVYSTVAAVLHLGNISFEEDDGEGGSVVEPSAEEALTRAADLLSVDPSELRQALTHKVMVTHGTVIM